MRIAITTIFSFLAFSLFGQGFLDKIDYESVNFRSVETSHLFQIAEVDGLLKGQLEKVVDDGLLLELDTDLLSVLHSGTPSRLKLDIPVQQGGNMVLHLEEVDLFSAGVKVLEASTGREIDYSGRFFWGLVEGEKNSMVSLSIFEGHLMGFISIGSTDYTLGQMRGPVDNIYALYQNSRMNILNNFTCYVSEEHQMGNSEPNDPSEGGYRQNPDNCVNVYVEADHDLYQDKGSVSAASDYVLGLFNQVFVIFADEEINLAVSELLVWDTPSPYNGPDAVDYLEQFTDELNGNYNGDIAHLVNLKSNLAGVAWTDILCWPIIETTAFSGVVNFYENVPTYSWSVNVIAHEIGHNLGSRHTHACVWNNNNTQIDDCGNEVVSPPEGIDCYNSNNPIIPSSGTIMSYCHALPNVGIDFNNGLGSQPGDLLRSKVHNGSCLGDCEDVTAPVAEFTADITVGCAPLVVNFQDLSENDPDGWDWIFDGGDPSQSNDQNPSVLYEMAGHFNVSLEVTNAIGADEITKVDYIQIEEEPTAAFNFNVDDLTVGFINNSDGGFTYEWNFGDGNTSTLENPIHTYAVGGEYDVTLVVTNGCGADLAEATVQIIDIPTPDFDWSIEEGCAPLEVQFFNNSSSNATSLLWEFPGGEPSESTEENPVVVYHNAGEYDVTLTASNDQGGESVTEEGLIAVNDLPVAEFAYEKEGRQLTFENNSSDAESYFWDFGDGNDSEEEEPEHEYSEDGQYPVMLIAENDCGRDTSQTEIVIATPPVAGFTVMDFDSCAPVTIEFLNESSSNADSFVWIIQGAVSDTLTTDSLVYTFDNSGTYDIIFVAISAGGSDTLVQSGLIQLIEAPSVDFEYAIEDLTVDFEAITEGADGLVWDFGDGSESTEANPLYTYEEVGIYQVRLTAWNVCDTIVAERELLVGDFPSAEFEILGETTGCVPLVVEFELPASSNAEQIEWQFPGGTPDFSTDENPVVTYSEAGLYSVALLVTNALGEDERILLDTLVAIAEPHAWFEAEETEDGLFEFTNLSEDADQFQWDFGDESQSEEFEPAHQYESPGEYIVTLIAESACGSDTSAVLVEFVGTSVNNLDKKEFKVFPNPTLGKVYIEFEKGSEELTFEVFNILGENLQSGKIGLGTTKTEIDLSGHPSGTYFIQLNSAGESHQIQIQVVGE